MFLTVTTRVQAINSMYPFVPSQQVFLCKPFVTHRTQIRSWLVIMWTLSDIITDSLSLQFKGSFTCKYVQQIILNKCTGCIKPRL